MAYKKIAWLLFVVFSLTYGYFYWAGDSNQNSRLDLVRALAENRTYVINDYAWNTVDTKTAPISNHKMKKYGYLPHLILSNKAPGSSLWGAPFWAFFSSLFRSFELPEWRSITWTHYFTTWFAIGIPSAACAALVFTWLVQVSSRPWASLLVTAGLGLGTVFFPYAVRYYSHSLAAAVLFSCFYGIWYCRRRLVSNRQRVLLFFIIGLGIGFVCSLEYPAVLPALAVSTYLVLSRRSRAVLFAAFFGFLIGICPLLIYNCIVSGQINFVSYGNLVSQGSTYSINQNWLNAFSWPSFEVIFKVLFGPQRGMIYASPWLIFAFFGWHQMFKQKHVRTEAAVFLGITVAMVLFYSLLSRWNLWQGGNGCGARHMIVALPFMAASVAYIQGKKAWLALILLQAWSVFTMTATTAVNPNFQGFENPIFDFALVNFFSGNFSLIVESPYTFTAESFLDSESASWTIGSLLGLTGPAQLFPLVLIWVVGFGLAAYWIKKITSNR